MLSLKRGAAGRDPCAGDPQGGTKCVGDHDEKEKAVTDAKATVTADSGREQLARSRLFPAQPCPPGRDSTCDDRLDEARQPSRAGAWPLELR